MTISIDIHNSQTNFQPGEKISGTVSWQLSKEPKEITVNLFWQTDGKGTQDMETVESRNFKVFGQTGSEDFEFEVPIAPYSFSGRLISISWYIEAFPKSGRDSSQYSIVISPTGEEVHL